MQTGVDTVQVGVVIPSVYILGCAEAFGFHLVLFFNPCCYYVLCYWNSFYKACAYVCVVKNFPCFSSNGLRFGVLYWDGWFSLSFVDWVLCRRRYKDSFSSSYMCRPLEQHHLRGHRFSNVCILHLCQNEIRWPQLRSFISRPHTFEMPCSLSFPWHLSIYLAFSAFRYLSRGSVSH